ncbi:solute carrier family 41 member 1-like isoform X2 [Ornithodoros turicata]
MGLHNPTSSTSASSPSIRRRMAPRISSENSKMDRSTGNSSDIGTGSRLSDLESQEWLPDEHVTLEYKEPLLGDEAELKAKPRDGLHRDLVSKAAEPLWSIGIQVFVPFLIAGFGTVGAGLVLDIIQHWIVFQKVSELFILVPALLGLKGNLEMTLASRLSTQANLGNMDTSLAQWKMATGNLALLQCQATVVGFLASLFAMVMGWIPDGEFSWKHALLLCSSSLVTASVASLVLGTVMIGVVIMSRKCHINPDNVATPIAASLGDLTTLALLAVVSSFLYTKLETDIWFVAAILIGFLMLLPLWGIVACGNPHTREVLHTGWCPVISAMMISSVGGCILDFTVSKFHGVAVFQPVINGVGGNLVAVQASRISTFLHQKSELGSLPVLDSRVCVSPLSAFFGKSIHSRTARVLLLMVLPGHLVFTYGIRLLKAGHTSVTPMFLSVYLPAGVIQVFLLLYIAHVMVHWMWTQGMDPDNSAIPYLTALGDLIGTALLALSFLLLSVLGDGDSDVGD